MQTGKLRCRVVIQKQTTTQDESGQPQNVWSDFLTTWASIAIVRTAGGKEVYSPSGFISELSHIVSIRYPSVKVNSTMRITYRGRIFMVQAVSSPNEERKQMDLLCKEENT